MAVSSNLAGSSNQRNEVLASEKVRCTIRQPHLPRYSISIVYNYRAIQRSLNNTTHYTAWVFPWRGEPISTAHHFRHLVHQSSTISSFWRIWPCLSSLICHSLFQAHEALVAARQAQLAYKEGSGCWEQRTGRPHQHLDTCPLKLKFWCSLSFLGQYPSQLCRKRPSVFSLTGVCQISRKRRRL